jgi:phage protein D
VADPVQTFVQLLMGSPTPSSAPLALRKLLRTIEVIQSSRCPSGFRMTFSAPRYDATDLTGTEYPALDTDLLDPFVRVQVTVQPSTSTTATVLMDGFITRQEVVVGQEGTTVTVIGEDVSVMMDLIEISAQFQNTADSAIVKQILGNYSSLGVTLSVTVPTGESAPANWVPQQNCTDRYLIQMLAARHGFLFYVLPGSSAGTNTAYWGPPVTTGTSQKALTINMSRADNLTSLTMTYDALAPTITYGSVLDLTKNPAAAVPIAVGSANPLLNLAQTGPIPSAVSSVATTPSTFTTQLSTLTTRGTLFLHPGLSAIDAQNLAQAKTNRSAQEVVVIEGEVETAQYGAILQTAGLVDLRGVGTRYDGTYFVKQVNHNFTFEKNGLRYLQKFVLVREGFDSKIQAVTDY